jgi:hypothetical protein
MKELLVIIRERRFTLARMGKAGEKQKRRPKFKDKKQSERFKETARQLGADESSDAFDRVIKKIARSKRKEN